MKTGRKGNFVGSDQEWIKHKVKNSYEQMDLNKIEIKKEGYKGNCAICKKDTERRKAGIWICKRCENQHKKIYEELLKDYRLEEWNFNKRKLKKEDWTIPGTGEEGIVGINNKDEVISCMSSGVNKICKNVDGVKARNLKCDSVLCPNCWEKWRMKAVFEITCKLEAYAKVHNERIAHVQASIHPDKSKELTWTQIKNQLYERAKRRMQKTKWEEWEWDEKEQMYKGTSGSRSCHIELNIDLDKSINVKKWFKWKRNSLDEDAELKTAMGKERTYYIIENGKRTFELRLKKNKIEIWKVKVGVKGGMKIFHPLRIADWGNEILISKGWNPEDEGEKKWRYIRKLINNEDEDIQLHDLTELGYHIHCFVFPSFLQKHEDQDFVIKKISDSNSINDTIKMVKYVLSHAGVSELRRKNKIYGAFGDLHNFHPEDELSEMNWTAIRQKVARKMGMKFDVEKEQLVPSGNKKEIKCKNCGTPESDWLDAKDIIDMTGDEAISYYHQVAYRMSDEYAALFKQIYNAWKGNLGKGLSFFMLNRFSKQFNLLDVYIVYRGYDPPDDKKLKKKADIILLNDETNDCNADLEANLNKEEETADEPADGIDIPI